MLPRMSYRDDLYARYDLHPSHAASGRGSEIDRVYGRYLRGWLPADRAEPILDLGCGSGSLLAMLARLGYQRLSGVDRSPVQVDRSRAAVPGAEILLGEGADVLRARPGAFGLVLCIDVLEHLQRDELLETLRLIAGALRPGGALIAQVPNAESPFHGAIRYGDLTHEIGFTPGALRHAFAVTGLVGFEARECGPVPKNLKGVLRAGAWQVLRGLVRAWNAVETGSGGAGVYTRVILARAVRGGAARGE